MSQIDVHGFAPAFKTRCQTARATVQLRLVTNCRIFSLFCTETAILVFPGAFLSSSAATEQYL